MEENFSLKNYNTFGIDTYAKYFSEFNSADELRNLLETFPLNIKTLILGGGSNILFTKNFEGLVLKNKLEGISLVKEDEEYFYVQAGGGESWHGFVQHCISQGYNGAENLSLIPGNVGASPMQNIGAYGVELKDIFYTLEAFHLAEKKVMEFNAAECEFGYRQSVFKKKYKDQFAILTVTFRLPKEPHFNTSYGAIEQELEAMKVTTLTSKNISEAVINIRQSKLPDPHIIGNAGSFFKNPEINLQQFDALLKIAPAVPAYKINEAKYKIAAGWLIEQCGWKGFRKGDAGCHKNQALVLVNYGQASGNEIFSLSEEIKASVAKKFKVNLEIEVNVM